MSEAPRTDALEREIKSFDDGFDAELEDVLGLARDLQREIIGLQEDRELLDWLIEIGICLDSECPKYGRGGLYGFFDRDSIDQFITEEKADDDTTN